MKNEDEEFMRYKSQTYEGDVSKILSERLFKALRSYIELYQDSIISNLADLGSECCKLILGVPCCARIT